MARRRKQTPPPSFGERLNATNAKAGAALSVFQQAAADLEQARHEQDFLASEIEAEIDHLYELLHEVNAQAESNEAAEAKIRAFFQA